MYRRPPRRLRALVCALAVSSLALLPFVAPPAASAAELSCLSTSVATVQKQILSEVNAARSSAGAKALTENAAIDTVAMKWSASQAGSNTMKHNPSYSSQMPTGWTAAGENVAYGYAYNKVTTAWLNSSGHRANILNKSFTHIGIGVACSSKGQAYYTQNFGAYKTDPGTTAAAPTAVTASAGAASATVTWSAETYSGARAITGFTVTASPGGLTTTVAGASARKATISGLTPGFAYTFTVTAKNSYGTSPASAKSNAITPSASQSKDAAVVRAAGQTRFGTSATLSRTTFAPGVPVAYLANGMNFPDALSGAAAAGVVGGPVLLTTGTSIPAEIATELKRLKPQRIVVLGGAPAVSDAVLQAARGYTTGAVTRTAGPNRYDTSAAISRTTFTPGVDVAYLASGANFPDALSGAAAAGSLGGPVLLTLPGSLPKVIAAELARLKPKSIVVLGGAPAVADTVLSAARSYTSGSVTRAAGANRFGTAAAVSESTFDTGTSVVYVANGMTFPDALSGAAAGGVLDGPVLLTNTTSLPATIADELKRLKPERIVVLGGPSAVGDGVVAALDAYVSG